MTDVRLSITLDAEQAKRAAADFRAGYQALTQQLQQPVGQAAALNQVKVGALAATGATKTLGSAADGMSRAAGRQQAALVGLAAGQAQAAKSTRQLSGDQQQLASAAAEAAKALKEQADAASSAGEQSSLLDMAGGAVSAFATVQAISTVSGLADGYKLMMARLRLATDSQEEFNTAQAALSRIAADSGSTMAAMVTLYGRIGRPLREAGVEQGQILRLSEAVALSFRVSGASAAEAENGIVQFAQALGSGALRGDEFNTIAEQAPRLMQALAAGLGVPTAALRKMAEEGKLTTAAVTAALTGQFETIKAEAQALPDTVESAMTRLSDAVTKAFGAADTSGLVEAIDALREKLADPAIAQGMVDLAESLFKLGEMALGAARWFAELPSPIRNTALAVGLLAIQFALVAPLATSTAAGLSALWTKAVALIPSLGTLAASLTTVAGALTAAGGAAVFAFTGYKLAELYDLIKQHRELVKSQGDYEQGLTDAIAKTKEYADAVVVSGDALAGMTETERRVYLESLRLAEEHYRKKSELLSRQSTGSQIDPAALEAAREASKYRKALQAINDAETERTRAATLHKEALEKIKADQLKAVQDALGKEIQAYNAANLELNKAAEAAEAAMRRRVGVLQEFDQLIKDLGGSAEQIEPSVGAAMALKSGARQALQAGDTEEAIRQARAAGAMLRELQQAGENTYGFKGMAQELKQIADAATQLDVDAAEKVKEAAQAQVDAIKARMDDLLAKAEAFKRLNIEFTGFEQSAATLEAQAKALAERLKKYMVIPVNYIGAGADAAKQAAAANAQAGDILDPVKRATGGWIDGPGTPTSDSILLAASRGEYVLNARSAGALGAANLDFMNRSGQLPSRDHLIPQIPSMPSLDRIGERQPLNLAMPWGGSYALEGTPAEVARFQDDLRRTARKFGRTHA